MLRRKLRFLLLATSSAWEFSSSSVFPNDVSRAKRNFGSTRMEADCKIFTSCAHSNPRTQTTTPNRGGRTRHLNEDGSTPSFIGKTVDVGLFHDAVCKQPLSLKSQFCKAYRCEEANKFTRAFFAPQRSVGHKDL